MSASNLFYPNLMSTEDLRDHLKKRFPSQNLDAMQREQLIKIFINYAAPMHRRVTHSSAENLTRELPDEVSLNRIELNKRRNHQTISAPTTIETVTNACKKIKLVNLKNGANGIQKRAYGTEMIMDCDDEPTAVVQSKRTKITWP